MNGFDSTDSKRMENVSFCLKRKEEVFHFIFLGGIYVWSRPNEHVVQEKARTKSQTRHRNRQKDREDKERYDSNETRGAAVQIEAHC